MRPPPLSRRVWQWLLLSYPMSVLRQRHRLWWCPPIAYR